MLGVSSIDSMTDSPNILRLPNNKDVTLLYTFSPRVLSKLELQTSTVFIWMIVLLGSVYIDFILYDFHFSRPFFQSQLAALKAEPMLELTLLSGSSRLCIPPLLSIFPPKLLTIYCNNRLWVSVNYFINFLYPSYRLYILFREFIFLSSFIVFEKKEVSCFWLLIRLFPGWVLMQ